MFSLIYNFIFTYNNVTNLIEKETLELIREKYLNIQYINDIENYIMFIGKMKSFCNINSYLWNKYRKNKFIYNFLRFI